MGTENASGQFATTVESVLQNMWEFYPSLASGLGLHDYDGRLPDISAGAMSRRVREVESALESLRAIDASALESHSRFDLRILTSAVRKELFELTEIRIHETNPMDMLAHIELSSYVKRDYAPLEQRAAALVAALEAVPSFLDSLQAGLSGQIGTSVLEASVEAYEGVASFYDTDLPSALATLGDRGTMLRFEEARRAASQAVRDFAQHLRSLHEEASDDFAVGEHRFMGLLGHGEMVGLPLERVLQVGEADLERNLARFREVAGQIDPARSPQQIMGEIARDHPQANMLIPTAASMLEDIRRFLIDREIVSVPSEVRCETTETPTFMRWAFAAMDMPGPFETKATEAYYYVTPVEEHWTDEQKEQWLTSFSYASLQNISIHETYPGHYVHYLHTRSAPSILSRVFGAYSFWEGWGHYTEEMMIEQGLCQGRIQDRAGPAKRRAAAQLPLRVRNSYAYPGHDGG